MSTCRRGAAPFDDQRRALRRTWQVQGRPREPGARSPHLICRQCGAPLPGRRTSFCGDPCVEAFLVANDPRHASRRVFERDSGVCAACGLDTVRLREVIGVHGRTSHLAHRTGILVLDVRSARDDRMGVPSDGHLWEADHILPVVAGGGQCGLDNLQTLCVWCHRLKTAEQTARAAEARRKAAAVPALFQEAS